MGTAIAKQQLIEWIGELDDEAMLKDLLAAKDDQHMALEWDELPARGFNSRPCGV